MIAVDSSTLVAFLQNDTGPDTLLFEHHLTHKSVGLPPAVLTEVISANPNDPDLQALLAGLIFLETTDGYWERTGRLRHAIIQQGLKARLPDALIAQSCLDHGVALITRDQDFRHYAAHGGLQLA